MSRKEIVLAIISLVLTALGIFFTIFFYYDAKRSTENQIVEALSERYESVDKEMSYEQALEAVDKENAQLKADSSVLQSENTKLQSEVSLLKNENERSEKITLAESYVAANNYKVAIPILNSISDKTPDVVSLIKDYTTKYESSLVTEAESLANSGKFDSAVALIDEALEIIPDSKILLSKKENITPKYLVDTVEYHKAKDLYLLDSKEYIKMGGKSYRHAIFSRPSDMVGSMFNKPYSANAFYNLDGKYSQLSGIVGHIDFSGSGQIGTNDAGQVYGAEITIMRNAEIEDSISKTHHKNIKISLLNFKGEIFICDETSCYLFVTNAPQLLMTFSDYSIWDV